ncbi:MAG: sulfotransferase domain-containing protein [Chloroflexi bacterium]|nr:sulfotransferase domain-containing protein [Chloroflexota bacterium]
MSKRLIMVMGVQRSGTTALFQSLSRDLNLISFNESQNSEIFNNFLLSPEPKIRPTLISVADPVLLKPISETKKRTVTDLFKEFKDYDLQIVWIYRDPANVFYFMTQMGCQRPNRVTAKFFAHDWNRRNRFLLEGLSEYPFGIMVVRYEDLEVLYRYQRHILEEHTDSAHQTDELIKEA